MKDQTEWIALGVVILAVLGLIWQFRPASRSKKSCCDDACKPKNSEK